MLKKIKIILTIINRCLKILVWLLLQFSQRKIRYIVQASITLSIKINGQIMFALDTTIITDKKHYFSGWCPLMLKMYLQKNICHILVQTVINSIITIEMIYIQLYSVREIHFIKGHVFSFRPYLMALITHVRYTYCTNLSNLRILRTINVYRNKQKTTFQYIKIYVEYWWDWKKYIYV